MTRSKWWTGTLPVHLLDDGMIECGDYPDWSTAFYVIKHDPYDREILDHLLEDIPVNGIDEPLSIGVWRRDGIAFLSDGHHRAVALTMLGIKEFPYRWYWKRNGSRPVFELEPMPEWITEGEKAR